MKGEKTCREKSRSTTFTIRLHAKRGRIQPKAGFLTGRSSLPGCLPIRFGQWRPRRSSLHTVAGPCGILTRFPFHSPFTASTSGHWQT